MAAPQHWTSNEYPKEFDLYPPRAFLCAKNKDLIFFVSDNHDKKKSNGVIVFDASSQQMKRLQAYPKNTSIKHGHSYCYHPQTHKIFILEWKGGGKMIIYDIARKQWKEHPLNVKIGINASLLCVDDTIHIFGGDENVHHLVYDIKAKSILKGVKTCEHKLMHIECGVMECVHIPKTSTVFVIGGQYENEEGEYEYSASMYGVSFESGSAASSISATYTMPKPLSRVAALFVHPFILLFGGISTDGKLQDNIYAFDIDKDEWRESTSKIPRQSAYHAILANDQKTIHLFGRVGNYHYSISLDALLNGQVLSLFTCLVSSPFISFRCHYSQWIRLNGNVDQESKEQCDGDPAEEERSRAEGAKWNCAACTFLNDASTAICTMCHSASRPSATDSVQQQGADASNKEDASVAKNMSETHILRETIQKVQNENEALKLKFDGKMNEPQPNSKQSLDVENKDDKEEKSGDELLSFLRDERYRVNLSEQYYAVFKQEDLTEFDVLVEITKQDLIDMNITKKGHQIKILRGIERLKQERMHNEHEHKNDGPIAAPAAAYSEDKNEGNAAVDGPHVIDTRK